MQVDTNLLAEPAEGGATLIVLPFTENGTGRKAFHVFLTRTELLRVRSEIDVVLQELEPQPEPYAWTCPSCKRENQDTRDTRFPRCMDCGNTFFALDVQEQKQ
jgi:DNA-directed RNA polymerase subunit RPC12/RpoP